MPTFPPPPLRLVKAAPSLKWPRRTFPALRSTRFECAAIGAARDQTKNSQTSVRALTRAFRSRLDDARTRAFV
eukprot:620075-Pleurochrysis_carterae.AAC.10